MRNRRAPRTRPLRAVLLGLLLSLLAAGVALLPAGTAGAADSGVGSFVSQYGETGTPVRYPRVWHSGSSTITPTIAANRTHISVSMSSKYSTPGPGTITFSVPSSQTLAVGDYTAIRDPNTGAPSGAALDISDARCTSDYRATFSILDFVPEASRFAIRYEIHCGRSPLAAFGEVWVNEPMDPALLVTGRQVTWPMIDPTAKGVTVPIYVANTSPDPLALGEVAITGAADFVTVRNRCTDVQLIPGGECAYEVSFVPSRSGEHTGTLTVTDSGGAVRGRVELGGRGSPGHTQFKVYDQGGSYSPAGTVRSFGPGQVSATGGPAAVRLVGAAATVQNPGDTFYIEFATGGPRLAVGTYDDADNADDRRDPTKLRLEPGGYHRTCTSGTGSFTIRQIEFDAEDQVTKFAASFESHCSGRAPALYGSIAYRADDPAPPVSHAPPSAVGSPVAVGGVDSVRLSWVNPTDGDFDHVVVRKYSDPSEDGQPPGRVVYTGTGNTVTIPLVHLEGETADLFHITPINSVRAPGPTTTLRTTRIAIRANHSPSITTTPGAPLDLIGYLGLASQGKPAVGFEVLAARVVNGARGPVVARATTDAGGKYTLRVAPTVNTRYVTYFPGSDGYIGAQGHVADVAVTPAVTAKPDRASGALGTTFRVAVTCRPADSGATVALQRWNGKVWATTNTTKFTSSGSAAFAVKPAAKGTTRYRVVKPATAKYGVTQSADFTIKTT